MFGYLLVLGYPLMVVHYGETGLTYLGLSGALGSLVELCEGPQLILLSLQFVPHHQLQSFLVLVHLHRLVPGMPQDRLLVHVPLQAIVFVIRFSIRVFIQLIQTNPLSSCLRPDTIPGL